MPGTNKPPLGSRVNWGHPLTNGLRVCALINEVAGSACVDIASGRPFLLAYGNKDRRVNAIYGASGNTARWQSDVVLNYDNISVMAVVVPYDSSQSFVDIVSRFDASSSPRAFTLGIGGAAGQWRWLIVDSGGNKSISSAAGYSVGSPVILVGTANNLNYRFFVNGQETGTAGATTGLSTSTSGGLALLGRLNDGGPASTQFKGEIRLTHVWSRALTPTEVAWLAAEPYAFIAPPAPYRKWFVPATAPAVGQPIILRTATIPNLGGSLRQTRF